MASWIVAGFLLVVVTLCRCHADNPLSVIVEPTGLLEGMSQSLSVSCKLSDVHEMGSPMELALYKDGEKTVSLSSFHPEAPTVLGDSSQPASNAGSLTTQGESHLTVLWTNVSEDHAGNYECKATVFDESADDALVYTQNTTVEYNTPTIIDMLNKLEQEVHALEIAQAETASQNEQLRQDLDTGLDALSDQMDQLKQELEDEKQLSRNDKRTTEDLLFYSSDYINGTSLRYHIWRYIYENIERSQALCEFIGGHLADFQNIDEMREAKVFITSLHDIDYELVVGIKRSDTDADKWVSMLTGEPALDLFEDWAREEGDCGSISGSVDFLYYHIMECEQEYDEYLVLCETRN